MSRNEGILSVQFISMICLGFCLILRTSTFLMSVESLLSILAVLVLWMPMRLMVKNAHPLIAAFLSVFLTVGAGLFFEWVNVRIIKVFQTDTSTIVQSLYLLLLVPVMVAQSHASKKQKKKSEFLSLIVFILLMPTLGLVREFFGAGSVFSYDLRPGFFPTVWILRQPAGIAFFLSIGLTVLVFLYRKYKDEHFQLKLEPQSHVYQGLPRFRSQAEVYLWRGALAFIFASVSGGLFMVVIDRLIIISESIQNVMPLIAVFIQVIMTSIVYYSSKGVRSLLGEWKIAAFIIPFQTMIMVFPMISPVFSEIRRSVAYVHILAYLVFVIAGAFSIIILMLFVRAIKQKLIFGRRPNSFEGIPLFFVLAGMFLLILNGFWPSISYLFSIMSRLGA